MGFLSLVFALVIDSLFFCCLGFCLGRSNHPLLSSYRAFSFPA